MMSGNSHKVSDRLVEPFEFTTNMIDVWCYDLEKKGNKVFKDMAGVGRFVIGLAHDINVINSPELKLYIRNFIQKNISNYIE